MTLTDYDLLYFAAVKLLLLLLRPLLLPDCSFRCMSCVYAMTLKSGCCFAARAADESCQ